MSKVLSPEQAKQLIANMRADKAKAKAPTVAKAKPEQVKAPVKAPTVATKAITVKAKAQAETKAPTKAKPESDKAPNVKRTLGQLGGVYHLCEAYHFGDKAATAQAESLISSGVFDLDAYVATIGDDWIILAGKEPAPKTPRKPKAQVETQAPVKAPTKAPVKVNKAAQAQADKYKAALANPKIMALLSQLIK